MIMRVLILSILMLFTVSSAEAEVFVWNDHETGLSLSYPDSWRRQVQLREDERLRIMQPQGHDFAQCALYTMDQTDPLLDNAAVVDYFNNRGVLDAVITKRTDNAGFGQTAAVYSEVNHSLSWAGQRWPMQAMVFDTISDGVRYSLVCSAVAGRLQRYRAFFLGIASSVDLQPVGHPLPYGLYRDFMREHVYLTNDLRESAVHKY